MKYLAAAVATLFVVAAQAPAANAETATCAGGVYNSACIAGAYDYVVVRRPRAVDEYCTDHQVDVGEPFLDRQRRGKARGRRGPEAERADAPASPAQAHTHPKA